MNLFTLRVPEGSWCRTSSMLSTNHDQTICKKTRIGTHNGTLFRKSYGTKFKSHTSSPRCTCRWLLCKWVWTAEWSGRTERCFQESRRSPGTWCRRTVRSCISLLQAPMESTDCNRLNNRGFKPTCSSDLRIFVCWIALQICSERMFCVTPTIPGCVAVSKSTRSGEPTPRWRPNTELSLCPKRGRRLDPSSMERWKLLSGESKVSHKLVPSRTHRKVKRGRAIHLRIKLVESHQRSREIEGQVEEILRDV